MLISFYRAVKLKDVKLRDVPMVESLRVKDIFNFAKGHLDIFKYIPILKKGAQPDRKWLVNLGKYTWWSHYLVNTLLEKEFDKFITERLDFREKKYKEKRSLDFEVLPEFAASYQDKFNVSSKNGKLA